MGRVPCLGSSSRLERGEQLHWHADAARYGAVMCGFHILKIAPGPLCREQVFSRLLSNYRVCWRRTALTSEPLLIATAPGSRVEVRAAGQRLTLSLQ
jgi:hypothetical protein